ncbi:DNA-binding transcriptional regulator, FadR family [Paramicrobacterium humi]|uniref:DNA-binding transcriptional regulator, FadR family n=1 Tax=Paramicrobacterium humi TaxID=640635 RepID=A0A1H4JKB3_9MICO|nr:GntR family transcriptional regulator [Microbacterium humi]SEB46072.1 DNA-binding transcriptional regulator, FadR family [Microbacterium humi]
MSDSPADPGPHGLAPVSSRYGLQRGNGLYDRVVADVGGRIVSGELAPGTTIYVDQVCEQLGISRSVVREAMRTLSAMGLVESRPQRGTRVQPREAWDLLNPRIVEWRGEGPEYLQQMLELLELRLGVEQAAAHFAAERMSDQARTEIVAAGHLMQRSFEQQDAYTFFCADAEIHRLMLEGSGNAVIAQFAGTVTTALRIRGSHESRSYSAAQSLDARSANRHLQLAEALAAHDAAAAQNAVSAIIFATLAETEHILAVRRQDRPRAR